MAVDSGSGTFLGKIIASDGSNGWIATSSLDIPILNTGTATANNVTLTLDGGKVSTVLGTSLQAGTGLQVEVEAYKTTASGGLVTVDDFLFSNVNITRQTSSDETGATSLEAIGFKYDAVQQSHNTLDSNNKYHRHQPGRMELRHKSQRQSD